MKKIWITGAEGHIGTALLELLEGVEYQLLPTDIHEVDITKIDEVTQFVYVNRPDVIINCAGMTDVAECEKNIDEAYRVNAIGVRNVALAANDIDAKVIQISTDDVFDKESRIPYNEFDTEHPRTNYGKTKEDGEKKAMMYMAICDVKNLPDNIPMETNPRKQKLTMGVPKKIKASLLDESYLDFYLLNRGLCIAAADVTFNNYSNEICVSFDDFECHGDVDGGHTYKVILENRD